MCIQDLLPGGACRVKVIYGPEQRAPTTTGRDNLPGPTPSAGAPRGLNPSESTPPAQDPPARFHVRRSSSEHTVTDCCWRIEDKGCELRANHIPTKVMVITHGRAATVERLLHDEHCQLHLFISSGRINRGKSLQEIIPARNQNHSCVYCGPSVVSK